MTDVQTISDGFVTKLLDGFQSVRAEHAERLAAFACNRDPDGNAEEDAAFRQRYLREFLRFTAHEIEVVLYELMAKSRSAEERSQAARVYLYSVEQGFWKPQPNTIRLARNLFPSASASQSPDVTCAVQALVRANSQPILNALMQKVHAADATERDRLLAIEKVLLGAEAGLWPVPEEWK
jgi:hypothetical protein